MSRRSHIVKALVEKFKAITKDNGYNTDLAEAVFPRLVFWDQATSFPSMYVVAGSESREYLPSQFTWGFLGVSIKIYCKSEYPQEELELLIEDIEKVVYANHDLSITLDNQEHTTEILVTSIVTDEGILDPYGVGEINLQVRYPIFN